MYTFEQKRQFTLSIQEKKFNLGTLKEILYLHKKNFHWNVDVPHTLNWGGGPPPSALVLGSGPPWDLLELGNFFRLMQKNAIKLKN